MRMVWGGSPVGVLFDNLLDAQFSTLGALFYALRYASAQGKGNEWTVWMLKGSDR